MFIKSFVQAASPITREFLSYLLVMVIIVALCGVAIFIGTTLRKRKDKQEAEAAKEATDNES